MSTTSTIITPRPHKVAGFCDAQGIAHSWADGPTLTMNPPISTRFCVNCGQQQRFFHSEPQWEDWPRK